MDSLVKTKSISNIVFRTDASQEIGTGHVMRCLTLADAFHNKGVVVSFICRDLPGHLSDYIKCKGYNVFLLPFEKFSSCKLKKDLKHSHWLGVDWETDANETEEILGKYECIDGLIIDHYALDKRWEEKLKKFTQCIIVIDDLADRKHTCNILLDQNYYLNMYKRYEGLVPPNCVKLLGPQYCLLREEFSNERKSLRGRDRDLKTILVFFGGSDPTNETYKILKALENIDCNSIRIHVVVGQSNKQKYIIKELCKKYLNMNFHYQINYISKLMSEADLAICAGGSITWERYCLGLPAILISVAHNQVEICETVSSLGIDWYIGKSEDVNGKEVVDMIKIIEMEISELNYRSKKALEFVDSGGTNRVTKEILNNCINMDCDIDIES